MTDKIMSINGVSCYEESGIAYLRLEDVARGLGFTTIAASGNEVVRWGTVYKYLTELGVATSCNGPDYRSKCPEYIPENIFYRLAMKAKNETAEKFQALVADEIIPSVRRNGVYATTDFITKAIDDPDFAIQMLQKLKEERAENKRLQEAVAVQTQQIAEMQPKEQYYDKLVDVNSLMNFTDTAKAIGISRKKMLDVLVDEKYLYRQGSHGKLIPYEKNNHGYFEVKEQKNAFGSWAGPQTFVTVAGRQLLLRMLDEGYFD